MLDAQYGDEQNGFSIWINDTPHYQNLNTACIGHFHCEDQQQGQRLISEAQLIAKKHAVTYLIGPMNGNTWQSYRLVTESDGSPPFLLEPVNPQFYPHIFNQAQFMPIGEYYSARMPLSNYAETDLNRLSKKFNVFTIRQFNLKDVNTELTQLYHFSVQAFANNFLYTPISQQEFSNLFQPIIPLINPEYLLMIEDNDHQLLAYIFAIPDYLEGTQPKTLIIKTCASLKPGLGGYLVKLIHQKAKQHGFKAIIHALMHTQNRSTHISKKYAQLFRRYQLYAKRLAP